MTDTEKSILDSLSELDRAAKSMSGPGPKPNIASILSRLDTLTDELPKGTDPNLLHYLHKKSYEKARLFLLGRGSENASGSC
jgi:hypothetical protein